MAERIEIGSYVTNWPGAGQPKITGTVIAIDRDRALIEAEHGHARRWRSLRHLRVIERG